MNFELRLGDELQGEVQSGFERSGEWAISSPVVPSDWTGKLMSRTNRLYAPGEKRLRVGDHRVRFTEEHPDTLRIHTAKNRKDADR